MSESFFEFNIDPKTEAVARDVGNLYLRIGQAMEEEGVNRADLAERMGLHKSEISRKLNGTSTFTARWLALFAHALGRHLDVTFVKPEPQKRRNHFVISPLSEHLRATEQQPVASMRKEKNIYQVST